jgi:GNAT superfamily N-acetyltransferase
MGGTGDDRRGARKGRTPGTVIRGCRDDEIGTVLGIINDAARAYLGAVPADCWHDPYMTASAIASEQADGVVFTGYEANGELIGVMGVQAVANVHLIRHAYVRTAHQGSGVGTALIEHLCAGLGGEILIGTWAAATWAISFYERQGFKLVSESAKSLLLRTYWSIPPRQAQVSVVLANPPLADGQAVELAGAAAPSPKRDSPAA